MSQPPGRVSLRAIAREAGVSQSTVSRSLRNDARISAPVRERVRAAAERLGYRPDPQVSRLMTHMRSMQERRFQCLIGFLLPPREYPDDYSRLMVSGARARAEALGYVVDDFRTDFSKESLRTLNRVLRARGAEGVLILPRLDPEPPPAGLDLTHLAAVSCAVFDGEFPAHQARPGHHANMALLMRALGRRGLVRPGLVTWEDFDRRQRWAPRMAYYRHYHDVVRTAPPPVFDWHARPGDVTAPFLEWFRAVEPDALLVVGPVIADAVAGIFRRGGVRRPPPVFCMGHTPPGYSGVNEKPEVIGSAAVDMLTSHIVRNEKGWPADVKMMALPGELRVARRRAV